ncbi:MAG: response regulator transcription factor [Fretibacterium sp.]|nr:response regulator transcription factor [Fretibacterium sp.]
MSIRVLLADDHELFLEGLKALLLKVPDIKLVGQARDGLEVLELTERMKPEVVVMDVTMPRLNGIHATHQIREKFPEVRVLILSMHSDRELIVESLKAGALGYILKECSSDELCKAIQAVMMGQYYLTPSVLPPLIEDYLRLLQAEEDSSACPLSDREQDVLKLFAKGLNAKQIAARLDISKNTVDTHRRRIMDKVGCNSMADLTRYAIREGYLDLS